MNIRKQLADWLHKGAVNDAAIKMLQRRQERQAKRAQRNHNAAKHSWHKAAQFRRKHQTARDNYWSAKARRQDHRAHVSQDRSQALIGKIKARFRRRDEIQGAIKRLKAEIAKMGPTLAGNSPDKATGGSDRERVVWCANRSLGSGHFYSQSGGMTFNYCWTPIPWGYRSDCSQYVMSVFHAAGLGSPDGSYSDGGYTGSLAAHCRHISLSELQPGDLILYGYYPYHHVELYVGHGLTIGHGTAPIDHGSVYQLSSPNAYRPPEL